MSTRIKTAQTIKQAQSQFELIKQETVLRLQYLELLFPSIVKDNHKDVCYFPELGYPVNSELKEKIYTMFSGYREVIKYLYTISIDKGSVANYLEATKRTESVNIRADKLIRQVHNVTGVKPAKDCPEVQEKMDSLKDEIKELEFAIRYKFEEINNSAEFEFVDYGIKDLKPLIHEALGNNSTEELKEILEGLDLGFNLNFHTRETWVNIAAHLPTILEKLNSQSVTETETQGEPEMATETETQGEPEMATETEPEMATQSVTETEPLAKYHRLKMRKLKSMVHGALGTKTAKEVHKKMNTGDLRKKNSWAMLAHKLGL